MGEGESISSTEGVRVGLVRNVVGSSALSFRRYWPLDLTFTLHRTSWRILFHCFILVYPVINM